MPNALLGKKLGMTRIFIEGGRSVPVTVIEAGPCSVLEIRTPERNGYHAAQLGFDDRFTGEQWERIRTRLADGKRSGNLKGLRKPLFGHYQKTAGGVIPKRFVKEVRLADDESLEVGQEITVDVAEGWKKVDVIGTSKGRGTQGTMRAWNFSSGPNSHGSKNRRNPGSIGMGATPGRVLRGRKMYTRWGAERSTVRNLTVVGVQPERNLILVKGGVPGPTGGYLLVRKAVATRVAQ
ncbi:50S ribosomal protein L3 [Planctomycetota bacterium]